jgi:hypothetical protein
MEMIVSIGSSASGSSGLADKKGLPLNEASRSLTII